MAISMRTPVDTCQSCRAMINDQESLTLISQNQDEWDSIEKHMNPRIIELRDKDLLEP
jgi:hypothetical protein